MKRGLGSRARHSGFRVSAFGLRVGIVPGRAWAEGFLDAGVPWEPSRGMMECPLRLWARQNQKPFHIKARAQCTPTHKGTPKETAAPLSE